MTKLQKTLDITWERLTKAEDRLRDPFLDYSQILLWPSPGIIPHVMSLHEK